MPDPKKIVAEPTPAEKARAQRILELSRQWNVPSNQIFSKVQMRPSNSFDGKATPQYQSYWTFDAQGNIANSTRDYSEPQGTVYYTPQDIQLQQQYPGRGVTAAGLNPNPNGIPVSQIVNSPVAPVVTQRNMKKGGKIKAEQGIQINADNKGKFTEWAKRHGMSVSKAANHVMANKEDYAPHVVQMANFAKNSKKWNKAQYGTQIPDPNNPYDPQTGYEYLDNTLAPTVFDNQRMTYLNDVQPVYGNNPAALGTSLQSPTPNIQPLQNEQGSALSGKVGNKKGKGVNFGSVNINLGAAITGLAGAANQELRQSNVATQAARNQRLTLMQENYNPNQFGNGSQALFEHGGKIPEHVFDISPKQKRELEKMGYIVEKLK